MIQHQILAILFSDIVGYSKLMGENESLALSLLKKNREIHVRYSSKYHGKIIKEIGDGTLVVFSEVENAINYAQEIIKDSDKIPDLKLSIGIHIGEVHKEGNDVFGDGVNIASRIQHVARKNQILVSEVVYNNLSNRGYSFRYIGKYQLKNIKHPVKCYALKGEGLNSFQYYPSKHIWKVAVGAIVILIILGLWYFVPFPKFKKPDVYSIAVLPFENITAQAENDYFCNGIMEDILTQLSYISDLQVTSRTSSMKFQNATMGIPDIARQLGVNFILEGSVRKDLSSVLVTVQLIDARDDSHLWSGRYIKELSMNNIWEIQNEIAKQVARNLEIKIIPVDFKTLNPKPTDDYLAYDFYLKGREYYRRFYPEDNEIAIRLFKKALTIDTSYALAYAGLADAYAQKVLRFGYGKVMLDSAEYFAKLSILHDETLPEGYKTLGLIERTKNNMDLAISYTQKAVKINPNFTDAISNLGFYMVNIGQFSDGMTYFQKGITLNPRDPEPLNYMAILYYYIGDHEKAKDYFTRSMEIEPDNRFALLSYLLCLEAQQDWEAYASFSDRVLSYTQDTSTWHLNQGMLSYHRLDYQQALYHFERIEDTLRVIDCYIKLGDTLRAFRILEKMKLKYEKDWFYRPHTWADFWIPYNLTILNLLSGNSSEACKWLEISLKEGRYYMFRTFMHDQIILNQSLPVCAEEILDSYQIVLNEQARMIDNGVLYP